ncbi:NAD-dependent epimerase/dehydratase family protein [Cytobacillus oceanisediminis]|uniref:NAD-dependent epimerase/dehydratase family protein n=1 Tax=Cytobacillus TaxID=2675230 RepID=UPI00203D9216|nr:NAD-dependent epimerase/dehydratase family protein [Cytobacillus oceanisediminis]MBY0159620.1 NAD-dependent epimerase/dehydratase family protein [Cytobacillus firmus]MCM3527623.1 NAD-dependent epimerase/dehydratase family protein [Cytobacillus oceanisediminis]
MGKVLITGGCGFIGSHLAYRLSELGYQVIVVDNLVTGSLDNINPREINFFECDILGDQFDEIVKFFRPDYIFHLAAQANVSESIRNFLYDAQINILGTLKVIELSRKYNIKKIVFASSSAVYGQPKYLPIDTSHKADPLSPYGVSKYASEHYLKLAKKLFGIDFTILRYGNVYGPMQNTKAEGGVVAIFSSAISKNVPPIIFGDGEQTRDFVFVGDIVSANIAALKLGGGQILNVSSGKPVSINQLFQHIKSISNSQSEPIYKEERKGDIKHSELCIKETTQILQWAPSVQLKEGLFKTLNFYNK